MKHAWFYLHPRDLAVCFGFFFLRTRSLLPSSWNCPAQTRCLALALLWPGLNEMRYVRSSQLWLLSCIWTANQCDPLIDPRFSSVVNNNTIEEGGPSLQLLPCPADATECSRHRRSNFIQSWSGSIGYICNVVSGWTTAMTLALRFGYLDTLVVFRRLPPLLQCNGALCCTFQSMHMMISSLHTIQLVVSK